MPQLTLEIFLDIKDYNLVQKVLGVIWSTIVGSTYAFIYLTALDFTGWNHMWLKSVFVISGMWLLGAGFAIKLLGIAQYVRDEPLSIAAFFVAHLFFATYLYLLVKKNPPF